VGGVALKNNTKHKAMPIEIEVLQPELTKEVLVRVKWTGDHVFLRSYLDDIEHGAPRHVLVFFEKGDGDELESFDRVIGTRIIEGSGIGIHSLSAVAILGNQVVAKDRKRVRNGTSEAA
jgi:hypothetical protein